MAELEYEKLLQEWKERLGLFDWTIKLKPCCHPDEMELENVSGYTDWVEAVKSARIDILDPKHYGERIEPYDFEKTLVHELLHLKLSLLSLNVGDLQERYTHQLIDDLARAFVDAKREGLGKEG